MGTVAPMPTHPVPVATDYCMWYMATILTVYIVVCLLLYIYRRHRRYMASNTHYPINMHDQLSTDVYLKFWTGLRLAVLHLDHITAFQDTLVINTPRIGPKDSGLRRKPRVLVTPKYAWFTMQVHLDWCSTTLRHTPSKFIVHLPETVPVPRTVQHVLYTILREKHHLSLILRTGPSQREIDLEPGFPMELLPSDIDKLYFRSKPRRENVPTWIPPFMRRNAQRQPRGPFPGVLPRTRRPRRPPPPSHSESLPSLNRTPPIPRRPISVEIPPIPSPSPTNSIFET